VALGLPLTQQLPRLHRRDFHVVVALALVLTPQTNPEEVARWNGHPETLQFLAQLQLL
jgi:hypothetical protein